jgi:hypothetical protein
VFENRELRQEIKESVNKTAVKILIMCNLYNDLQEVGWGGYELD